MDYDDDIWNAPTGMNSDRVQQIMFNHNSRCDAGDALRLLLDLLVEANLHECDDLDDDTVYARVKAAEADLFCLATDWHAINSED